MSSWSLIAESSVHVLDVNCVRWHPHTAGLLASASDDGCIQLLHLSTSDAGLQEHRTLSQEHESNDSGSCLPNNNQHVVHLKPSYFCAKCPCML